MLQAMGSQRVRLDWAAEQVEEILFFAAFFLMTTF